MNLFAVPSSTRDPPLENYLPVLGSHDSAWLSSFPWPNDNDIVSSPSLLATLLRCEWASANKAVSRARVLRKR